MRGGFSLIETLISLLLATIGIVIMFEAFKAYVDNRSIAMLYEKAYIDMNTAYEIGKKIIDEGENSLGNATDSLHVDIVKEQNTYNGCTVYDIIPDSSEISSILGKMKFKIRKEDLGFKVLDCH